MGQIGSMGFLVDCARYLAREPCRIASGRAVGIELEAAPKSWPAGVWGPLEGLPIGPPTELTTSHTIDVQHLLLRLMDMHTSSIQSNTHFHPSTSCLTCSKIAQEVRDLVGFVQRNRSVSIAQWATLLNANGCSTCKKIVAYFESHDSKNFPNHNV